MSITHTRHETARYRLVSTGYGFELVRIADNASAFFQGEDATLWESNIAALEKIEAKNGWAPGNTFDATFDHLCSGYDEILTGEA